MIKMDKIAARMSAKAVRAGVTGRAEKAARLYAQFPWHDFKACRFAGFWPLHDEINLIPLMTALHKKGAELCLPVTGRAGTSLCFRRWSPDMALQTGRFGTKEPPSSATQITPDFIFLPLLAFGPRGARLGYGGGYYDRTVWQLRQKGAVFTCGVGYDAQETINIPMLPHDIALEAILTPSGFRRFS